MSRSNKTALFCILVLTLATTSNTTMQDDEKDCADQMGEMAACIPYVSGTAKKPTPECCDDTRKVRAAKPKCLCVLIKQSTDPSMGLPINTTLALQMPAACNIDASISDCPALLHLEPDSPDAKIFKQGDETSSTTTTTGSPPASASSGSTTGTSSGSSASDSKSTTTSTNTGGSKLGAGLMGLMIFVSIALILFEFQVAHISWRGKGPFFL